MLKKGALDKLSEKTKSVSLIPTISLHGLFFFLTHLNPFPSHHIYNDRQGFCGEALLPLFTYHKHMK